MDITVSGKNLTVSNIGRFDLGFTLDCGQCFRFELKNGIWQGVVGDKLLKVAEQDGKLTFFDCTQEEFQNRWRKYFDLDRDYESIIRILSQDETLKAASDFAGGIHILQQDIWEVICSFIISQNNNIPRIKGIIERLCRGFGNKLDENNYTFPSAEVMANMTVEDFAPLRAGFRVKYMMDAAKKIANGEIDIAALCEMPLDEARNELKKIYGVGDKVANCILLFGFSRMDALPVDVWIKRALTEFYGSVNLPQFALPYAGIAQQYIFHYARIYRKELFEK